MRFATFNLYQYLAPPHYWYERKPSNTYTEGAWSAKEAWIAAQLRALDADVVGFQEVFSAEALRVLVERAGYAHFAVLDGDVRDPADDRVHVAPRVALASRVPLADPGPVVLDDAARRELGLPETFRFGRTPLAAHVELPGVGPVRVVVAHLKSKRPLVPDVEYPEDLPWASRALATMRPMTVTANAG